MTLRKVRRDRDITQEQLAAMSDVDQTVISKLERGEIIRPSWDVVGRLARALSVEPEELFPLPPGDSVEVA
jgi:transcriptional regulator with XRE-family HTH domain